MMDWSCAVYADAPYTENEAGDFREETEQVVVSARGRTLAEAEANARVTAAATEMVEALQLLINARKSNTLHMEAHWLPAIAAIAKALGESSQTAINT